MQHGEKTDYVITEPGGIHYFTCLWNGHYYLARFTVLTPGIGFDGCVVSLLTGPHYVLDEDGVIWSCAQAKAVPYSKAYHMGMRFQNKLDTVDALSYMSLVLGKQASPKFEALTL